METIESQCAGEKDIEEGRDWKDFVQVKSESSKEIQNSGIDSESEAQDASKMTTVGQDRFQEKMETKIDKLPCFGSGTLDKPLVKFYFTSACPQLGNYFLNYLNYQSNNQFNK